MAKAMSETTRERLIEAIDDAFVDAGAIYDHRCSEELLDDILEIMAEQ
jgi:hypothetical protein